MKSLKSGGGARTPGKSAGSRNGRAGKKELGTGGTFCFSPYSTLKSRAQELEAAKSRQERSNVSDVVVKKVADKEGDSGTLYGN